MIDDQDKRRLRVIRNMQGRIYFVILYGFHRRPKPGEVMGVVEEVDVPAEVPYADGAVEQWYLLDREYRRMLPPL